MIRGDKRILIRKQLKNDYGEQVDGTKSMFVLKIWQKIKEKRIKFSQTSVTVLWMMSNYEKARNMQLKKLKSPAKIRLEQHQE